MLSHRLRTWTVEANGTTSSEWVPGSEARRIIGCTYARLKSLALVGKLKVLLEPGISPKYRRADVEAIAAARAPRTQARPDPRCHPPILVSS
jgi:hypothetical protein